MGQDMDFWGEEYQLRQIGIADGLSIADGSSQPSCPRKKWGKGLSATKKGTFYSQRSRAVQRIASPVR